MRTVLRAFVIPILISWVVFSHAQSPFTGTWKSEGEKSITLTIDDTGHFIWDSTKGRCMTQDISIWFLEDSTKTGTKWDYKITKKELVLSNPEDFVYQGKGNYLYLQFTDPEKEIVFKRQK